MKAEATATKTYHHGELRESLIASGIEILACDGVKGLSLRAVAKKAGVSQTAPYRHFTDKNALLASIAVEGFRDLVSEIASAIARHRSPDRQLEAAGMQYFRFAMAQPEHIKVMFGGLVEMGKEHRGLKEVSDEAFRQLLGLVSAGQEAGRFRSGDPARSALAAWSLVHGLSLLVLNKHISLEAFDAAAPDELAQSCLSLFKEGWSPRKSKGSL